MNDDHYDLMGPCPDCGKYGREAWNCIPEGERAMHDSQFAEQVSEYLMGSIRKEQAEVADMLEERSVTCNRHGAFSDAAMVTENVKSCLEYGDTHYGRTDSMNYALDMIAGKMGRIVVGDPFYADHWRDIAGYATLVANELAR